jgi:ferredoxin/coenzyme F420-reducing hydrogenase delta subunit
VEIFKASIRCCLMWVEGWFDKAFGPKWNPTYCLGALGYFYFWIVAVSGLYLYIFMDSGIPASYLSVEYLTHDQWWLGGVMRSLHRYASDAMVAMVALHVLREFAFDRYRGSRWFSWVTGVPMLWLIIIAGITGYWLVWDMLAQYVAIASTELLDWLPIFGEPVARNFLAPSHLDGRFFTLLIFLHIAVPLVLLFIMWVHLQRVGHARINPAKGLAVGTFAMLLVLSFAAPATSQGMADLSKVTSPVGIDWFYLWMYPAADAVGPATIWIGSFVGTIALIIAPWLPPLKKKPPAVVNLDNCNGCTRCAVDCPFNAIVMAPRSDGAVFDFEAKVDSDLCTSCGICVGSCPTATPFRRASELIPGIDLQDPTLATIRENMGKQAAKISGPGSIMIFGCDRSLQVAKFKSDNVTSISLPCTGMLPPSFIDYVISRKLASGVVVTGCRRGECHYRLGQVWMEQRLDGRRDPRLRERVPLERLARFWAAPTDGRTFARDIAQFQQELADLDAQAETPEKSEAAQ